MAATTETTFQIKVDAALVRMARGAAQLHGIRVEHVVERIVADTLREYVETVRKSIPKPEIRGVPVESLPVPVDDDDLNF